MPDKKCECNVLDKKVCGEPKVSRYCPLFELMSLGKNELRSAEELDVSAVHKAQANVIRLLVIVTACVNSGEFACSKVKFAPSRGVVCLSRSLRHRPCAKESFHSLDPRKVLLLLTSILHVIVSDSTPKLKRRGKSKRKAAVHQAEEHSHPSPFAD